MKTITDLAILNRATVESGLLLAGDDPVRLMTSYSGRGMYGESCVAVVGSYSGFAAFVATLAAVGENLDSSDPWNELLYQVVNAVEIDSLGMDRVFYFPGVVVE